MAMGCEPHRPIALPLRSIRMRGARPLTVVDRGPARGPVVIRDPAKLALVTSCPNRRRSAHTHKGAVRSD